MNPTLCRCGDLAEYFGEEKATCSSVHIFSMLLQFCRAMDSARKAYERKNGKIPMPLKHRRRRHHHHHHHHHHRHVLDEVDAVGARAHSRSFEIDYALRSISVLGFGGRDGDGVQQHQRLISELLAMPRNLRDRAVAGILVNRWRRREEASAALDVSISQEHHHFASDITIGQVVATCFGAGIVESLRPRDGIYVVRQYGGWGRSFLQRKAIVDPGSTVWTPYGKGVVISHCEELVTFGEAHSPPNAAAGSSPAPPGSEGLASGGAVASGGTTAAALSIVAEPEGQECSAPRMKVLLNFGVAYLQPSQVSFQPSSVVPSARHTSMPELADLDLSEGQEKDAGADTPTKATGLSERVLASGPAAAPTATSTAAPVVASALPTPPPPPLRAPGHTGAKATALARQRSASGDADAVAPVAPALALLNRNGALGGEADGGNRERSGSDWSSGSAPTSPMIFRAQPPGSPGAATELLGQVCLAENEEASGGEEDRALTFHTPTKSGGLVLVDSCGPAQGGSLKSTLSSETGSDSDSDSDLDGSMSPPVSGGESGDSDGYHTA